MNDQEYAHLRRKIQQLLGMDIDQYKEKQMRRRLEAFLARQAPDDIPGFVAQLEHDEKALKDLKDVLTIHVSEFFRDPAQFRSLERTVLPGLLQGSRALKIWSAACSHGAEPYSIAIALAELGHAGGHKIIATDIDEGVLKRAMAGGPYHADELRNVSGPQLRKYFLPSGNGYKVVDDVRKRVQFYARDLLRDNFESGFDLIVCRNVIIYFSGGAKQRLVRKLYESLKPGGVLFLGGTEALLDRSAAPFERLFGDFYRKAATPGGVRQGAGRLGPLEKERTRAASVGGKREAGDDPREDRSTTSTAKCSCARATSSRRIASACLPARGRRRSSSMTRGWRMFPSARSSPLTWKRRLFTDFTSCW